MRAGVVNGVTLMIPKVTVPILNAKLYPVWFNLAKCFTTVDDDSVMSNERLNKIFLNQLKTQPHRRVVVFAHGGVLICAGIYAGVFKRENAFEHLTPFGGLLRITI